MIETHHRPAPGGKSGVILKPNVYTKRCPGCGESFCTEHWNAAYCAKASCKAIKARRILARKLASQKAEMTGLPRTFERCLSGHYYACVRGDEGCGVCAQIAALTADNAALRKALEVVKCSCEIRTGMECPLCRVTLRSVRNDSSYLNDEQFESVKAGDFYCAECKGDEAKSGHKYFWTRELAKVVITQCHRCEVLQSSDPGKVLLDAHVAELARWKEQAALELERRKQDVAEAFALRQRLEAAEAAATRLRAPLEVFARAVPVVDSIPLADTEPVYVHCGNGSWLVCFVGAFRAAKAAMDPVAPPAETAMPDIRCSGCSQPAGAQHLPRCHRQGLITSASDYRDRPEGIKP